MMFSFAITRNRHYDADSSLTEKNGHGPINAGECVADGNFLESNSGGMISA
jgi:hypothetical protein